MTTDITELAQSMKAASEKLKEIGIIHNYSKSVSAQIDFEKSATPANVIALVEALEKAQQRITQLESRTVKLPPTVSVAGIDVYEAGLVRILLTAAGIKLEAE
ncbi:hypothetical protein [Klebsiella quasipneumoniae]|uniref:hypothetical protein n=1 Tax=Klebsiella quasipneumoniae TaxID=1463165 RepID=UPI00294989D6|nr:hypothetical protein [Klebsiella quasipneumoniae]MDV5431865.1 hypothetical protein [Klebsiella quasipneumoniae]